MSWVKEEKKRLMKRIERMSRCRPNDAVKLAFLEEGETEEIDRLNLEALTEFKRSANGTVEIRLIDRVAVLKLLLEWAEGEPGEEAAEFFRALERSAPEEGERE